MMRSLSAFFYLFQLEQFSWMKRSRKMFIKANSWELFCFLQIHSVRFHFNVTWVAIKSYESVDFIHRINLWFFQRKRKADHVLIRILSDDDISLTLNSRNIGTRTHFRYEKFTPLTADEAVFTSNPKVTVIPSTKPRLFQPRGWCIFTTINTILIALKFFAFKYILLFS